MSVSAADKYLRKGAAGSGSGADWTNAYSEMSSVSWTGMAGSTLWVAAGTYTTNWPGITLTDNLTIKRATVASHGAASGWSDTYDGQVTVNAGGQFLFLDVSHGFTFDGMGFQPWKFRVVGVRGFNGMILNGGSDNATIRGLELDGLGEVTNDGDPEDGFRWVGGSNAIIEHNYIHDFQQVGGAHNDGVQGPSCTNITFRYNIFKNSGMHLFLGDYEWDTQYCNGITINHNLFYNDASLAAGASYNCIVFKGTNQAGTATTKIENNTFNLRGHGQVLYLANSPSPGCCNNLTNGFFRNNIIYSSNIGDIGFYTHTNNLYFSSGGPAESGGLTSDPLFVDVTNNDYRLQAGSPAKNAGASLGYTADFLGNPMSGAPDMGAFEVQATVVEAPTNLRYLHK